MESNLAIAIPTYNRAEMLRFNLLQIIEELKQFKIPVYISDDSTNEETKTVICQLKKEHSLFYYKKNEVRLGHDSNCLHTLSLPKEQYIWYIGDSLIIKKGAIEKILNDIKNSAYDFIAFNAEGRNLVLDTRTFNNGNELFENLGWHLTMTGATVYNRNSLLNLSHFDVTKFKNFPQTALIFEQFASKESSLHWINERLFYPNPNKNSYWASKVFEVFIDDLRNFLHNLPDYYSLKSKNDVFLQHAAKTRIFNYQSFVFYRTELFFDYTIFKKYKNDFKKITNTNTLVVMAISLMWAKPLKRAYELIKKLHLIFGN